MKITSETDKRIEFHETAYSVIALGAVFVLAGVASYITPQLFSDPPPLWLGVILLLIGLPIMAVPTYRLDVTVDGNERKIVMILHTLIKRERREIRMDDLKRIRYSQYRRNRLVSEKGGLKSRKDWQEKLDIHAVMKNGEEELIVRSGRVYSGIGNALEDESPNHRLARRIAEMAGVPLSG